MVSDRGTTAQRIPPAATGVVLFPGLARLEEHPPPNHGHCEAYAGVARWALQQAMVTNTEQDGALNPLPALHRRLNDGSNPESESGGALPVAVEWPLRSVTKRSG
jgi:hypothetical protein